MVTKRGINDFPSKNSFNAPQDSPSINMDLFPHFLTSLFSLNLYFLTPLSTFSFLSFLQISLYIQMGFAHLFRTDTALATFRATFDIPLDVDTKFCLEGNIENDRRPRVVFFSLMAISEGGVRFPVDPLLLRTLSFYGLCPNQLPLNFYRVVSCVSQLNNLHGLTLNHHDINFMYNICCGSRTGYYLKAWDTVVRLISCLPDSNRNSTGEYVKVSENWLAGEHPCSTSPLDIGRYSFSFSFFNRKTVILSITLLILPKDFPFLIMLCYRAILWSFKFISNEMLFLLPCNY